ncbi:hypothetical protein BDW22DRAFT_219581 [Trametopsis cervina]|nr:hypothetical protein BDW22DRAFT_219581 [Trametopsis cervina]
MRLRMSCFQPVTPYGLRGTSARECSPRSSFISPCRTKTAPYIGPIQTHRFAPTRKIEAPISLSLSFSSARRGPIRCLRGSSFSVKSLVTHLPDEAILPTPGLSVLHEYVPSYTLHRPTSPPSPALPSLPHLPSPSRTTSHHPNSRFGKSSPCSITSWRDTDYSFQCVTFSSPNLRATSSAIRAAVGIPEPTSYESVHARTIHSVLNLPGSRNNPQKQPSFPFAARPVLA